jgi:ferric-dicitrate binding protein FerR (iron transport regulator)
MENQFNTEDFLAKWANGELSDSELEAFEKSEEFDFYNSILEGTDVLEVPPFDKEGLFKKVQEEKIKESKVVRLFPKWTYAAAATIAILLAATFMLNQKTAYSTDYGEQRAILLPDGSEAILNAKSQVKFDERNWKEDRSINMKGEAFFKVKKGKTFKLITNDGLVTVLGTQFSVNSTQKVFEVLCFEGQVKVEKDGLSEVISKGQAVRVMGTVFEAWSLSESEPSWLQKESDFRNAPLHQVIKALENQFEISINSDAIDSQMRFTGSFTHTNLEKALRTVFEPLEIKFTFKKENSIILIK